MLKLIITILASLAVVAGVSYGASHYIAAGIQTIEKEVGEDFEIVLEANPTTGYQWQVNFDPEYLELIEQKYLPDFENLKGAIGAGGQKSFKFLALEKGETEIKFSYERSWEEKPIKTLTYKVIIK